MPHAVTGAHSQRVHTTRILTTGFPHATPTTQPRRTHVDAPRRATRTRATVRIAATARRSTFDTPQCTDCATTTPCIIHSLVARTRWASDSQNRISTNNNTIIVAKRTLAECAASNSTRARITDHLHAMCIGTNLACHGVRNGHRRCQLPRESAQAPCRLAHASQGRTVTAPTPASSHHRRLHYHHHHHLATAPDCTVTARVRHAGWPTR